MDAGLDLHQYFPIFEFRVFLDENGQHVLIAQYFCGDLPPEVESVLDIRQFKESPEYPDQVQVLYVEVHPLLEPALEDQSVTFFIIAERA